MKLFDPTLQINWDTLDLFPDRIALDLIGTVFYATDDNVTFTYDSTIGVLEGGAVNAISHGFFYVNGSFTLDPTKTIPSTTDFQIALFLEKILSADSGLTQYIEPYEQAALLDTLYDFDETKFYFNQYSRVPVAPGTHELAPSLVLIGADVLVEQALMAAWLSGDDLARLSDFDDKFLTFAGDDTVEGNDGNDALYAGDGNDRADGGTGNDTVYGGNGDDLLWGVAGDDSLQGNQGQDQLFAGDGDDRADGGQGADVLHGGIGADSLWGGADTDTLYGGSDNDSLWGNGGTDHIAAGDGDDWADGGNENDTITGGYGADTLLGGSGDDRLHGGDGDDNLRGGSGSDLIGAADGNDTVNGGTENDLIFGGAGMDSLLGGGDDDTVNGGGGNDTIDGGTGADLLYGNIGDDVVSGGAGADLLYGNLGDDLLSGGRGDDTLAGGAGSDSFVFMMQPGSGFGHDTISDFQNDIDSLLFDANLWGGAALTAQEIVDTYATVIGGAAVFDFGSGNIISVSNVTDLSLLVDDILLIG